MVKMIFSGKVLGILVCTPFLFVLSELSPQKSSPSGNFRLARLLRLPLIGAILAQRTALHNTLLAFSPISRKILHERPGTFGQLRSPWRNTAQNNLRSTALLEKISASLPQRFSASSAQGWADRAEMPLQHCLFCFHSSFQDVNKSMSISLCSLRMDKRCFRMYN